MRTTIDLPPALMRAAKARAAERVTLPLIARDARPAVMVTNEDIADAFDAEDMERHAAQ